MVSGEVGVEVKFPDDFINKIICGDCLGVMKEMPDKCVDLVLTDPPYDVNFAGWDVSLPQWLNEASRISKRVAFTPGIINVYLYPPPNWILCWAKPGSTRRNGTGGFNHWEPILFYGKRKIMVDFKYLPDCIHHSARDIGHPCPKPLVLFQWLVSILSDENDIILDPFIGSGTAAKAAKDLKRNFIGIEINPDYCKIAEERLAQGVL